MRDLKDFIERIEKHTGEKFNLDNRRHFHQLDSVIKRQLDNRDRKLNLIAQVLESETEDSLYTSSQEFIQKRYK